MDDLKEMPCPVCAEALAVRITKSRNGNVSLMLVCVIDGRHFRGFINDREYVGDILDRLDAREKQQLAKVLKRDDDDEKVEGGWQRLGRFLGFSE